MPDTDTNFKLHIVPSEASGCKYAATLYYRRAPTAWSKVGDVRHFVTKRGALRDARRRAKRHLKFRARKSEVIYFNA